MQERETNSDALRDRLGEMEDHALADQHTIDDLREAAVADHMMIASLQAEGVIGRREIANLQIALESARRIGTAIGILMAHRKFTSAEAFDLLARSSQDRNRKVRDIADYVIESGTLPDA